MSYPQEAVMEMSVESKARLFDINNNIDRELSRAKYQIFRVTEDGRWHQVLARSCAPHPDGDSDGHFMAIVEGEPHRVAVRSAGSSQSWFEDGDDCETVYSFELVANGIVVGECSYREY